MRKTAISIMFMTLTNYEKASGIALKVITQEEMDEEHRIWVEVIKKRMEGS